MRYSSKKIACLGGGQLGLMLGQAAVNFGMSIDFLDASSDCACKRIFANCHTGNPGKFEDVKNFIDKIQPDILLIESEHVSAEGLAYAEQQSVACFPSSQCLSVIQDKLLQRQSLAKIDWIVQPQFYTSSAAIQSYPCIAKTKTGGYDGKGIQVVNSLEEAEALEASDAYYFEDKLDIESEFSLVGTRGANGDSCVFPLVSMAFRPGHHVLDVCQVVDENASPALSWLDSAQKEYMQNAFSAIGDALGILGTYAIEFILDKNGAIYLNEIAPRVHNSGHFSQDGCSVSQFENHLRAVLGIQPLASKLLSKAVIMINILSLEEATKTTNPKALKSFIEEKTKHLEIAKDANLDNYSLHLYAKDPRELRKIGHINLLLN